MVEGILLKWGGWKITRGSDTVYMRVNRMHSHVKICLSPQ